MTPEQKFGYFSKHGRMPPETKQASKTHGVLYLGDKEITQPLPYALLNKIRAEYIANGYSKDKLKIRKHYG